MKNSDTQINHNLRIYEIRGQKIMLDEDLAFLYGTQTKFVNLAVKRNFERFPEDFCFQVTEIEWENLKLQIATSSLEHGGRRKLPWVFTEHGIIMLATVLRSTIAIQASIQIVKIFIEMRKLIVDYSELEQRLNQLELQYDHRFEIVFQSIRELMKENKKKSEPFILDPNRKKIGLVSEKQKKHSDG